MKAKQRRRPVTVADEIGIESALNYLKAARTRLRTAGANNAAAYVARAIKSTQGALNHARGMLARQERSDVGRVLDIAYGRRDK